MSLETSGALDIAGIDPRVSVVMDLKTPGSGESGRNRWENLAHLRRDGPGQVRHLRSRGLRVVEAAWSRSMASIERCMVLFSPAWGTLEPRLLAEWILADRLPVCFQVQLHKYLWGEERGH